MWIKKMATKILLLALCFQMGFNTVFAQTNAVNPADPKAKTVADPAMAAASTPVAAPVVLGFLEWKSLRVHEAQQKVEQMNKTQGQAQVWQEGKTAADAQAATSGPVEEQKLNFNVDVALQLNIQDYFSMYLKNLTPEEIKEASKKLNADEVAELLVAYKNSQEKDKKLPLKFSTVPRDNAKSKKQKI